MEDLRLPTYLKIDIFNLGKGYKGSELLKINVPHFLPLLLIHVKVKV